jgi:hypothetical protein
MAGFDASNFLPLSSMANSDAPRHYTYKTGDNKATVVASGYFNDFATTLNVGDLVWVVGVTGGTEVLFVAFIDAISAAGVVTTLSSSLTLA